jgi:hypothetical protein
MRGPVGNALSCPRRPGWAGRSAGGGWRVVA